MIRPAVEAWLEERLSGVPEELADEVRSLVTAEADRAEYDDLARLLAGAALYGFDRSVAESRDRGAALRLLAADAALTYAFEAAVDTGTDVSALAEYVGLHGELGRRLASSRSARQPDGEAGP
jgi:hypothetical protein